MGNQWGSECQGRRLLQHRGYHQDRRWWLANGIGRSQWVQLSSWQVGPSGGQAILSGFFSGPSFNYKHQIPLFKLIAKTDDVIGRQSSDEKISDHIQFTFFVREGKNQRKYATIRKKWEYSCQGLFPTCLIIFIELKKNMIRQYDFPRIFQNVVGEVIPLSLRNRQNTQRRPLDFSGQLEEISSSYNSSSNAQADNGILYVKSKKKKLVRRLKFNKTSSCFSGKQGKSDEDKFSQKENSPLIRNFLKRKQLTLQKTEKHSCPLEQDQIFDKDGMLDEQDEMRSNLAQGLSSKRKIKFRQKTSFERYFPQKKDKDIESHKNFKQRTSQGKNTTIKNLQSQSTPRSKLKHKTFFKFDIMPQEKSHSKIDQVQNIRKKSKKKTVNFIILNEKENHAAEHMRTDSPRRGAKVQRAFIQKSSKFTGKPPTPHEGSNMIFSQDSQSNWSAKSVVSIKFTSTRRIKSKKTLRSQQSIFDDNSHFMIKQTDSASRYRTRTYIKFPHQVATSIKNYKSMTSLSQVSIDLRSDWSIAKGKRKEKRLQANKSQASLQSKKNIDKKTKMQSKVSILIKNSSPYLLSESQRYFQPTKSTKTFNDIVFKKKKTIMTGTRISTDPDAFAQLNNFHKFLNDSLIEENDQDMQKTLTKPVVIDSSIGHRQIHTSRMQNEENLMIDMGLTMIKKMSMLRQKRF